ncbi:MAG: FHA domain-containing protein [Oscillospiraceae bacterium]|nr:FHA domain-containing protein [Oscillospiraceae bacterium]
MKNNIQKRAAAVLTDIIIVASLNAVIWCVFIIMNISNIFLLITAPLTLLIYFLAFNLSPAAATPGMMIFGVKRSDSGIKRMPCAIKQTSDGREKYYLIPQDGLVFGRDPKVCSVLFAPDEPAVSRCHCSLKYNEQTEMFLLEDLGSTYGTFISDGTRVTASRFAALNSGDRFYIGKKENEFSVGFREAKE